MSIWLAIVGMMAATFGQRASFLLLPDHVQLPALLRRALRYVPAAVLTAIWAPELALSPGYEQFAAGVVAIAVAWRWRMTFVTIAAGLVSLHLFHWLL